MEEKHANQLDIEFEGCSITLHFEEPAEGNSLVEILGTLYEQLVYEELQKG